MEKGVYKVDLDDLGYLLDVHRSDFRGFEGFDWMPLNRVFKVALEVLARASEHDLEVIFPEVMGFGFLEG